MIESILTSVSFLARPVMHLIISLYVGSGSGMHTTNGTSAEATSISSLAHHPQQQTSDIQGERMSY